MYKLPLMVYILIYQRRREAIQLPNWSTIRKQSETLAAARRHRTEWTETECLRLIDLAEEPGGLEHAATALGRSYFAVMSAHALLLNGWVPCGDVRIPAQRTYSGWLEGQGDERMVG